LLTKRSLSAEGQEKIRLSGYKQFLKSALEKHKERFDYSMVLTEAKFTSSWQRENFLQVRRLGHASLCGLAPIFRLGSKLE
jgi:hypothetical protein